jgi:hypothetical protein
MCLYSGQGKNKHEWREFVLVACSLMLPTLHISLLQTPVTTKECKKETAGIQGKTGGGGEGTQELGRQKNRFSFFL